MSDHDRRCCPHLHERVAELGAERNALRQQLADVTRERDRLKQDNTFGADQYRSLCSMLEELTAERDAARHQLSVVQAKAAHQATCLREAHRACARIERRWRQSFRLMHTNQFAAQRDAALRQLAEAQRRVDELEQECKERSANRGRTQAERDWMTSTTGDY